MEGLLNILWFALCNLAGLYWLRRWRRSGRPQGGAVQLSALACMLVLLFPVISATDDLYAAQFAFETAVTQKSSKGALSVRFLLPQRDHHSPAAAFTSPFSVAAQVRVGVIAANDSLPVCPPSISHPPQDRAPPSHTRFL
jgi:hypothetical protein